jgi:predicted ATP-dependent serine protease
VGQGSQESDTGRAGTGKSHTLGTVAQKAISDGHPVILILGQELGSQGFWRQATEILGLGIVEPEIFLQAMSSAAEAAQKRGLILIDAINEGAGAQLASLRACGNVADGVIA